MHAQVFSYVSAIALSIAGLFMVNRRLSKGDMPGSDRLAFVFLQLWFSFLILLSLYLWVTGGGGA